MTGPTSGAGTTQSYRAPEFPPIFSVVPVTQGNMTVPTSGAGTTQPFRVPEFPPIFSVVPVDRSHQWNRNYLALQSSRVPSPFLVWYLLLNLQLQSSRIPSPLQCGTCFSIFSYRAPEFPPIFNVVPASQFLATELQSFLPSLVWYLLLNRQLQSSRVLSPL